MCVCVCVVLCCERERCLVRDSCFRIYFAVEFFLIRIYHCPAGAFLLLRAPLEALGGGWRFVSHLLGQMRKPKTDPATHKCGCCLANQGYFTDPAVKARMSKNGHTYNKAIIGDGPRQGDMECDQLVKRAAPSKRGAAAPSAGGGGSSRQPADATLSAGLGGMRLGASDGTAASSGAPAAAAAVAAEDEDGSFGHLFGEDGSGSSEDGSGPDGFNFELNPPPQARHPRHRFGEAERAKARMDAINAAPAAEPPASAAAGGGGAGGSGDGHLGQLLASARARQKARAAEKEAIAEQVEKQMDNGVHALPSRSHARHARARAQHTHTHTHTHTRARTHTHTPHRALHF